MPLLTRRQVLALACLTPGLARQARAQPLRVAIVRSTDGSDASRTLNIAVLRELRRQLGRATAVVVDVNASTNASVLGTRLHDARSTFTLALGTLPRRLCAEAASQDPTVPPYIAGLVTDPPQETGRSVSLLPAPHPVVTAAKELIPQLATLHAVYDPSTEGWWPTLAAQACVCVGVNLAVVEATSERDAANAYARILRDARPRMDAVWLLNNPRLVSRDAVLPYIIDQSWQNSLPLISQTLLHARAGALLALYPSAADIARDLVTRIEELLAAPDDNPGIVLARQLSKALNRRTAHHLGLMPTATRLRRYSLIFPVRK